MENKSLTERLDAAYDRIAHLLDVADVISNTLSASEDSRTVNNAITLAEIVKDYASQALEAIEEVQGLAKETA